MTAGKISILHIIGQLHGGGCERQLLGVCRRLDPRRFDLSLCWYGPMEHELDEEFRAAGVRTIFFDKFSMPPWRFFRTLREKIREVAPDIVHTWLTSANFWGRWAAVTCGVPQIVASERTEVTGPNLACKVTERLLARRTHRLANSEATAASVERYYGLPASRIRIIRNAVSLEPHDREAARSWVRRELALPRDHKLVVMVAHLREQKNHRMFVRAAARVCGERPDVAFASVGSGPLESEMIDLAASLGVADRVRFLGERADAHRWLAGADLFCFTTNFEGFPNAVLEAMLSGLPVVSTRFAGLDELLAGREIAVTVPLDDDAAMAREIAALLDDPERSARLGQAARDWVGEQFPWEALIRAMESFYEELAAGRGVPPAADG